MVTLHGDPAGSEGAASHFEARLLVLGPSGATWQRMAMSSPLQGSATVAVPAGAIGLFLVVVAMPAHFTGNQVYGYAYGIQRVPN